MTKIEKRIYAVCAVACCLFICYSSLVREFTPYIQCGIPLCFAVICICLKYALGHEKKILYIVDLACMLAFIIPALYLIKNTAAISRRMGLATDMDVLMSVLAVLAILEMTRRSTSRILLVISLVFMGYVWFGKYLPAPLGHGGYSYKSTFVYMFLSTEGIFGTPVASMTSIIFMFLIFGSMLTVTGVGEQLINMAYAMTGRLTGGPALTSVVSSAMMGMLSGSATANVATTGVFTIPLMKRTGYQSAYAGAIEAVASTGGQITPPIMGASAFVMAEMLGMKYIDICKYAIIPALLYYICAGLTVYLRAKKEGLRGLPKEELPILKNLLKESWSFIIPIVLLMYWLISGYSAARACVWTCGAFLLLVSLRKKTRIGPPKLLEICVDTMNSSLQLFTACACTGIIVAVIGQTGLGVKLSLLIQTAAGSSMFLALLYTMIACLVLGMGLPSVAAYIILVTILGASISQMGAMLVAVHMFILYYGAIAQITPPVALAAYAAGGIAGANVMTVGWYACRIGVVGFLVPYLFVYNPVLMMIGDPMEIIAALITAVIGVCAISVSLEGMLLHKLNPPMRLVAGAGGLLLMIPDSGTDLMGVVIILAFLVMHLLAQKKAAAPQA